MRISILCFVVTSMAAKGVDQSRLSELMNHVPAAELPACAAGLVRDSSGEKTAVSNVVSAAIRANPLATPLIVGAVAKESPESAALAAQVAAIEQPEQIQPIGRAAAGVVPARAAEIVGAILKANTNAYREVALSAARVAPAATRDILKAIGEIRPDLKPYLDKELQNRGRRKISVEYCLDRAELALARAHWAGLPVNQVRTDTGQTFASEKEPLTPEATKSKPPRGNGNPPGGRNYARP